LSGSFTFLKMLLVYFTAKKSFHSSPALRISRGQERMTFLPCYNHDPMQRIYIVGQSGSGKTTLAKRLSSQLGLACIELDSIYWQANWAALDKNEFRRRVTAATAQQAWVIDGNYSAVRDIVLARADTLVWLDYPLWRIFWQLTGRTLRRALSGEEIWNGNKETWRGVLFSKDSLYLWVLRTYRRHKRRYTTLQKNPAFKHLEFVHLKSPKQLAAWLEILGHD
jgi:adenylate kinase family enzyme